MRSSIILASLFAAALAVPQIEKRGCNHDNCLRALIASSAESFCSTYTTATAQVTLPPWVTAACSGLPSRVSSGCSCINTAASTTSTSTTSSTSSTSSSISSTSSSSSITSSSSSLSSTTTISSSSSSSSTATSTLPPYVRTTPPAGAIIVNNNPDYFTPGVYPTVQEGVDALSPTTTTPQTLFIYPGTYDEQVYIPALKSNLTVQGYTEDARTYESNTALITYNLALLNVSSDDLTATVRQWNPNTKFYNLNIANTFGHVSHNGQNLVLSAHTTNQGYYACQLVGYQDTLLANVGNQLYVKNLIVGAVDFIFGQTATAWLEQCDIRTIATGCVTASGRASASNPSWYVINNSSVGGINSSIPAGTNYLGRPWESFARVVFQNTYLSDVIAPAGWSIWSTTTPNTENVTFDEYNNYGPGSVLEEGPRANFSQQLNTSVTIESILGDAYEDEWWVDLSYF